jgi:hypothetical protein
MEAAVEDRWLIEVTPVPIDGAVAFTSSILRPKPIEALVSEVMAVKGDIFFKPLLCNLQR